MTAPALTPWRVPAGENQGMLASADPGADNGRPFMERRPRRRAGWAAASVRLLLSFVKL
jgi:hypothetical protein